ncbi:hypothetical protein PR048_018894 [Dryococelus australis]|uniref:Uncharacterized protein n=1 Tax=Dryococelus australis TaxID=614101 RepID=A0ABQ9H239_9NEOP|nr:hypothetical protein PR048_018894 [Dryococelus australis]
MSLVGGFSRRSPVSPSLHSDTAPYSPHLTLISSQDLDVKNRLNLSTLTNPVDTPHSMYRANVMLKCHPPSTDIYSRLRQVCLSPLVLDYVYWTCGPSNVMINCHPPSTDIYSRLRQVCLSPLVLDYVYWTCGPSNVMLNCHPPSTDIYSRLRQVCLSPLVLNYVYWTCGPSNVMLKCHPPSTDIYSRLRQVCLSPLVLDYVYWTCGPSNVMINCHPPSTDIYSRLRQVCLSPLVLDYVYWTCGPSNVMLNCHPPSTDIYSRLRQVCLSPLVLDYVYWTCGPSNVMLNCNPPSTDIYSRLRQVCLSPLVLDYDYWTCGPSNVMLNCHPPSTDISPGSGNNVMLNCHLPSTDIYSRLRQVCLSPLVLDYVYWTFGPSNVMLNCHPPSTDIYSRLRQVCLSPLVLGLRLRGHVAPVTSCLTATLQALIYTPGSGNNVMLNCHPPSTDIYSRLRQACLSPLVLNYVYWTRDPSNVMLNCHPPSTDIYSRLRLVFITSCAGLRLLDMWPQQVCLSPLMLDYVYWTCGPSNVMLNCHPPSTDIYSRLRQACLSPLVLNYVYWTRDPSNVMLNCHPPSTDIYSRLRQHGYILPAQASMFITSCAGHVYWTCGPSNVMLNCPSKHGYYPRLRQVCLSPLVLNYVYWTCGASNVMLTATFQARIYTPGSGKYVYHLLCWTTSIGHLAPVTSCLTATLQALIYTPGSGNNVMLNCHPPSTDIYPGSGKYVYPSCAGLRYGLCRTSAYCHLQHGFSRLSNTRYIPGQEVCYHFVLTTSIGQCPSKSCLLPPSKHGYILPLRQVCLSPLVLDYVYWTCAPVTSCLTAPSKHDISRSASKMFITSCVTTSIGQCPVSHANCTSKHDIYPAQASMLHLLCWTTSMDIGPITSCLTATSKHGYILRSASMFITSLLDYVYWTCGPSNVMLNCHLQARIYTPAQASMFITSVLTTSIGHVAPVIILTAPPSTDIYSRSASKMFITLCWTRHWTVPDAVNATLQARYISRQAVCYHLLCGLRLLTCGPTSMFITSCVDYSMDMWPSNQLTPPSSTDIYSARKMLSLFATTSIDSAPVTSCLTATLKHDIYPARKYVYHLLSGLRLLDMWPVTHLNCHPPSTIYIPLSNNVMLNCHPPSTNISRSASMFITSCADYVYWTCASKSCYCHLQHGYNSAQASIFHLLCGLRLLDIAPYVMLTATLQHDIYPAQAITYANCHLQAEYTAQASFITLVLTRLLDLAPYKYVITSCADYSLDMWPHNVMLTATLQHDIYPGSASILSPLVGLRLLDMWPHSMLSPLVLDYVYWTCGPSNVMLNCHPPSTDIYPAQAITSCLTATLQARIYTPGSGKQLLSPLVLNYVYWTRDPSNVMLNCHPPSTDIYLPAQAVCLSPLVLDYVYWTCGPSNVMLNCHLQARYILPAQAITSCLTATLQARIYTPGSGKMFITSCAELRLLDTVPHMFITSCAGLRLLDIGPSNVMLNCHPPSTDIYSRLRQVCLSPLVLDYVNWTCGPSNVMLNCHPPSTDIYSRLRQVCLSPLVLDYVYWTCGPSNVMLNCHPPSTDIYSRLRQVCLSPLVLDYVYFTCGPSNVMLNCHPPSTDIYSRLRQRSTRAFPHRGSLYAGALLGHPWNYCNITPDQWHVVNCCKVSWCLLSAVHTRRAQQEPVSKVEQRETGFTAATHERVARHPLHTCCVTSQVLLRLSGRCVN